MAIFMAMPVAAVYKNYGIPFRKHNVRATEKVFAVKPEAISKGMQTSAYDYFRFRILSADTGHHFATLRRRNNVCQFALSRNERLHFIGNSTNDRHGNRVSKLPVILTVGNGVQNKAFRETL